MAPCSFELRGSAFEISRAGEHGAVLSQCVVGQPTVGNVFGRKRKQTPPTQSPEHSKLTGRLISGLLEQQIQIETLERRIATLEAPSRSAPRAGWTGLASGGGFLLLGLAGLWGAGAFGRRRP